MMIEICKQECVGCTHDGYLCKQFEYLLEAYEKEIPKAPIKIKKESFIFANCPNCKMSISTRLNKYCNYCGQHLDWEGF